MKSNRLTEPHSYPCLMEYVGNDDGTFVVMFYDARNGVVVNSQNPETPVGYATSSWVMDENDFAMFSGTIELSND